MNLDEETTTRYDQVNLIEVWTICRGHSWRNEGNKLFAEIALYAVYYIHASETYENNISNTSVILLGPSCRYKWIKCDNKDKNCRMNAKTGYNTDCPFSLRTVCILDLLFSSADSRVIHLPIRISIMSKYRKDIQLPWWQSAKNTKILVNGPIMGRGWEPSGINSSIRRSTWYWVRPTKVFELPLREFCSK